MLPEFIAACSGELNKNNLFPSISTGAYRFPVKWAARIAMLEISRFLDEDSSIGKVFMACFDEGTMEAYAEALREIG